MQKLIAVACIGFVLASPGFAGGPTSVAAETPPAAPATVGPYDWSGAYVGLSYGTAAADINFNATSFATDLDTGNHLGIYGGYLFQRGRLVYGGEVSYAGVNGALLENGSGNDEEIKYMLDLKARVGFAANRALFYGVLGYSQANLIDEVPPIQESTLDGFSAGLGAEVAVTDRLNVGLEYLTRDLGGDYAFGGPGATIDLNVDTLSLRVGFSF